MKIASTVRRRPLTWLLGVALLIAAGWRLFGPDGRAVAPANDAAVTSAAAAVGLDDLPAATLEPQPPYLGDVAEAGGYLLSAVAVEDPTTPGVLTQVDAGNRLVAVELILGNVTGDAFAINPMDAILLDSTGQGFTAELGGRLGQIDAVYLAPGEKARGWVAFEIPEGVQPASIRYDFAGGEGRVVTTNLFPPPEGHQAETGHLSAVPTPPAVWLGQAVELDGYSFWAAAVADPGPSGPLLAAPDGYKVVGVEMVIANLSNPPLSISPPHALLVDTAGYVYAATLGGAQGELPVTDLAEGQQARGWVSFVVPEGAVPAAVKYAVTVFSGGLLEVALTPPPETPAPPTPTVAAP